MGKFLDLTGKKFGRLTVIKRTDNGNCKQVRWICKCDCGNTHVASTASLRSGHSKSCGCLNAEVHRSLDKTFTEKGGLSHTRMYKIWDSMRYRCKSDEPKKRRNYKERGIKVCDEWQKDFMAFRKWALENGYQDNLTIDRIDVNGDYEPSNCRWVTIESQQRNKRNTHFITFNGETKPLAEWAEIYSLNQNRLRCRIYAGWTDPKEILFGKNRQHDVKTL